MIGKIIGSIFLFCIVGIFVWLAFTTEKIGIVGIVTGGAVILAAVVVAAFVIKDKFA